MLCVYSHNTRTRVTKQVYLRNRLTTVKRLPISWYLISGPFVQWISGRSRVKTVERYFLAFGHRNRWPFYGRRYCWTANRFALDLTDLHFFWRQNPLYESLATQLFGPGANAWRPRNTDAFVKKRLLSRRPWRAWFFAFINVSPVAGRSDIRARAFRFTTHARMATVIRSRPAVGGRGAVDRGRRAKGKRKPGTGRRQSR